MERDKESILECARSHKLKFFNTAMLDKVYWCSGLPMDKFVDLVWEMAQKDFVFDINIARGPQFRGTPRRGVGSWNKTQIKLAEMIRAKVPERQLLTFGWPRYLSTRKPYQN